MEGFGDLEFCGIRLVDDTGIADIAFLRHIGLIDGQGLDAGKPPEGQCHRDIAVRLLFFADMGIRSMDEDLCRGILLQHFI